MNQNSCVICGCVKNCEKYLKDVFSNIKKIQSLFKTTKILMSFDMSNDYTLKVLCELKKEFDMDIIINKDPITPSRTVNIERARNKLLDTIYDKYNTWDYFIMIDMDDVASKPIYIESLIDGLNKKDEWDGLFFNNMNYYDYWALSFDDFMYSCWHVDNPKKVINLMNRKFKKMIKNTELLECSSAFGGFGIYKIPSFVNCRYSSMIDLKLFENYDFKTIEDKYSIKYKVDNIYDCEHRYFHMNAINVNKARLRISNKCLFPPYVGEHTNILDKF